MAKNQAKAKQHPEAAPLLFENYSLSSFHVIIQKIIGDTLIVNGAEKEKYITSNGKWGWKRKIHHINATKMHTDVVNVKYVSIW